MLVVGIEYYVVLYICYFDWIMGVKYIYDLIVLNNVSLFILIFLILGLLLILMCFLLISLSEGIL